MGAMGATALVGFVLDDCIVSQRVRYEVRYGVTSRRLRRVLVMTVTPQPPSGDSGIVTAN